ncbi:MAG: DUF433 domain-containing protein [Calditrichaceae bacterium]|nr:DUF433 domain-containing protein [Calditrichia bacterium]NUQ44359.1 DUF433 domain-containing protein [Calditrichaceae bacterium]
MFDRVEVDPQIHHGKPVIAGTRMPVHMVLGLLSNGVTPENIIRDYYENITKEDILACIRYAGSLVEEEEVHPNTQTPKHLTLFPSPFFLLP